MCVHTVYENVRMQSLVNIRCIRPIARTARQPLAKLAIVGLSFQRTRCNYDAINCLHCRCTSRRITIMDNMEIADSLSAEQNPLCE